MTSKEDGEKLKQYPGSEITQQKAYDSVLELKLCEADKVGWDFVINLEQQSQ